MVRISLVDVVEVLGLELDAPENETCLVVWCVGFACGVD